MNPSSEAQQTELPLSRPLEQGSGLSGSLNPMNAVAPLPSPFDNLASGLSPNQQAEFFQVLHETGITPDDDQLAKLLKALQLYKAYYETIPTKVQEAASKMECIRDSVAKITEEVSQQVGSVSELAQKVVTEAQRIDSYLGKFQNHIEEAIQQSADTLGSQIQELFRSALMDPIKEAVSALSKSHELLQEAADQNRQAAAALKKEASLSRRIHGHAYALAALVSTVAVCLVLWVTLHSSYRQKVEQQRIQAVQESEANREVLLQLARSKRTLELVHDSKKNRKRYLVMKDASGWQSTQNQGVLEFDE